VQDVDEVLQPVMEVIPHHVSGIVLDLDLIRILLLDVCKSAVPRVEHCRLENAVNEP
jgi:hypothetical protein